MDADRTVQHDADVAVEGGLITAVGPPTADRPAAAASSTAAAGIVLPGLVNAHTHLAMTMFRGLADDLDLDGFLGRLMPAEGAVLSADTVAAGTALAVAECLRAGITTALDMYFFPEAAGAVAEPTGFQLLTGPVFVEFPGADERPFPRRLEWAEELLQATPAGAPLRVPAQHVPAVARTNCGRRRAGGVDGRRHPRPRLRDGRRAGAGAPARHGGRTPIEVLRDTGLLGPRTVLAHGVHLSDDDLELDRGGGRAVAHCPASNHKLASGFARIPELLAAGVPVALGTDGAASANDLDPWLAMRLAAYSQAALARRRHHARPPTWWRWPRSTAPEPSASTDPTGSIEVGKRADLVVLDAASPALTPSYDPVSTLAYAASRADVRWVVAGGRSPWTTAPCAPSTSLPPLAAVRDLVPPDAGRGGRTIVNDLDARGAVHDGLPADGRRRARHRLGRQHQRRAWTPSASS